MTHIFGPKLTNRQEGIIVGTILGGSSIIKPKNGKNSYLSMRSKNAKWLEFKAVELATLASDAPFNLEKTYRWHSLCYPVFNEMYEKFYKDGKRRLAEKELELLTDVALAVWMGDCAKFNKHSVVFNTNIWGEKGTSLIFKYFKSLGFEPEVKLDRKCYRISLSVDGTKEYMKYAGPQLPYWYFD